MEKPLARCSLFRSADVLWRVQSKEEAIEWGKRCANPHRKDFELEIRQVFEAEDFGAELTPELREREDRLRVGLKATK